MKISDVTGKHTHLLREGVSIEGEIRVLPISKIHGLKVPASLGKDKTESLASVPFLPEVLKLSNSNYLLLKRPRRLQALLAGTTFTHLPVIVVSVPANDERYVQGIKNYMQYVDAVVVDHVNKKHPALGPCHLHADHCTHPACAIRVILSNMTIADSIAYFVLGSGHSLSSAVLSRLFEGHASRAMIDRIKLDLKKHKPKSAEISEDPSTVSDNISENQETSPSTDEEIEASEIGNSVTGTPNRSIGCGSAPIAETSKPEASLAAESAEPNSAVPLSDPDDGQGSLF